MAWLLLSQPPRPPPCNLVPADATRIKLPRRCKKRVQLLHARHSRCEKWQMGMETPTMPHLEALRFLLLLKSEYLKFRDRCSAAPGLMLLY